MDNHGPVQSGEGRVGDRRVVLLTLVDIVCIALFAMIHWLQIQQDGDPDGLFNLRRFGPVTQGLAIVVIGITIWVFTVLWIAGKS